MFKNLLKKPLPDFLITGFFTLVLITLTVLAIINIGIEGFIALLLEVPLVFLFYYLLVKAIILDSLRIFRKEQMKMPLFIYLVLALEWIVYWMVQDMMLSDLRLSSTIGSRPSFLAVLFFTNRGFFWLILEIITFAIFFPLSRIIGKTKTTEEIVILDMFRYLILLGSVSIISFICIFYKLL